MSKQHVALILAAGEGVRAQNPQAKTPKAYRLVAGPQGLAPMLRHSVQMLLAHARVDAVRCVIDPAHRLLYQQACEGLDGALLAPVEGGAAAIIPPGAGSKASAAQSRGSSLSMMRRARSRRRLAWMPAARLWRRGMMARSSPCRWWMRSNGCSAGA